MCLSRAKKNNKRVSPTAQVTFNIFLKAKHFSVCSSCSFCCPCSLSLNDSSCCSFCSSCTLLYIEVFCIPFTAWKLLTLGLLVYSKFSLKINLTCIYSYYVYICMYIYIYCIYLTCNNTASHRIDKGHFKMEKMQLHAKGRLMNQHVL